MLNTSVFRNNLCFKQSPEFVSTPRSDDLVHLSVPSLLNAPSPFHSNNTLSLIFLGLHLLCTRITFVVVKKYFNRGPRHNHHKITHYANELNSNE